MDERDVIVEKEGPTAKEETRHEHVFPSREIKVEQGPAGEGVVTLRFKNSTELASLQSALSQLLQQVWTLKNKLVCSVKTRIFFKLLVAAKLLYLPGAL